MTDDLLEVRDDGTLVLRVTVVPGAGRTTVVGRHGGALKVRVAAPPEGGRANEACTALLADALGLQASEVELIAGATSRTKRFALTGGEREEIERAVARLASPEPEGRPAGRRRLR